MLNSSVVNAHVDIRVYYVNMLLMNVNHPLVCMVYALIRKMDICATVNQVTFNYISYIRGLSKQNWQFPQNIIPFWSISRNWKVSETNILTLNNSRYNQCNKRFVFFVIVKNCSLGKCHFCFNIPQLSIQTCTKFNLYSLNIVEQYFWTPMNNLLTNISIQRLWRFNLERANLIIFWNAYAIEKIILNFPRIKPKKHNEIHVQRLKRVFL